MIIDQQKLEEIARTLIDGNPDSKEDRSVEISLPGLGELYIHYFGFRNFFRRKKVRSLLLRTGKQNIGIIQSTVAGVKCFNDAYGKPTDAYCTETYVLQTKKVPHYDFPEFVVNNSRSGQALFVRPNFRKKGFGRGLISLSLATLREESRLYAEKNGLDMIPVGFKVYITDTNVISFYEEKIGFIEKRLYPTIIRGSYLVPPQEIPPFVIKVKYS